MLMYLLFLLLWNDAGLLEEKNMGVPGFRIKLMIKLYVLKYKAVLVPASNLVLLIDKVLQSTSLNLGSYKI